MMRLLVIFLLSLIIGVQVRGAPPELKNSRGAYRNALLQLDVQFQGELKLLRENYSGALTKVEKSLQAFGDLSEIFKFEKRRIS